MSEKIKVIDGNFNVYFTTTNVEELPSAHGMEQDLIGIFAEALEQYLYGKEIEGREVHLMSAEGLSIEDEDDEDDEE